MPKERGKWLEPVEQPKLPALELESTGTGLLGLFTRGPAAARNRARQQYWDAVALGMDPAEAARRFGPEIMGPGFVPPKTKQELAAEYGAYKQSLARQAFPEPETREVPTGAYQVEPVLGPQGQLPATEFFAPPQYEPVPEAPGPFQGPFTATPTGEPIPTFRQVGPALQPYRREPIERQRVIAPEVRPEVFQPPTPTRAQLLAQQPPSQVRTFEQAYAELQEARKADIERQATEALAQRAAPGAPPAPGVPAPAPGVPAPAPGAPPTPGAPALSPTEQVEAGYESGIQRLRANPEYLLSDAGKNFLERKAKDMDIAQKREEAQEKRATAESVQRFRTHARAQGDAAEAEGDPERRDFWRAAEANPTQYLPQAKERAERAEKAQAKRDQRDVFTEMAKSAMDPKEKALYQLAAVHADTAKEVGQQFAQAGKPVELKGQMYRWVQTPDGGSALQRVPGGPAEEAEKPTIIEGQAYRTVQTPEGPRLEPYPGAPTPKAKPWYEGLSRAEAEAMSRDPALSPEQRRQAGEVAKALQTGAEKVAQAGVPQPVKPTQQSIGAEAERGVTLDMLDQMEQAVLDHPDWVGVRGTVNAGKAFFGQAPEGFADFKANTDTVYAQELHRLAQGALTPGEISRYGAFLPRVSADPREFQSAAQFRANMRATKRMIQSLLAYHGALQAGRPREDARAELLRTLEAERTAAAAEKAKRDQSPETQREQAEAQRQGSPERSPAAGRQTPAPTSAPTGGGAKPTTSEDFARKKGLVPSGRR
jgi:hypothetical protein